MLMERVGLEQLLGFLGGIGLVNDQSAAVVGEWPAYGQFAARLQAGQVLAMDRPDFRDFGLVLQIFDDGGVFHEVAPAGCTRSAENAIRVKHAWAPKRTAAKNRSERTVLPKNPSGGAS